MALHFRLSLQMLGCMILVTWSGCSESPTASLVKQQGKTVAKEMSSIVTEPLSATSVVEKLSEDVEGKESSQIETVEFKETTGNPLISDTAIYGDISFELHSLPGMVAAASAEAEDKTEPMLQRLLNGLSHPTKEMEDAVERRIMQEPEWLHVRSLEERLIKMRHVCISRYLKAHRRYFASGTIVGAITEFCVRAGVAKGGVLGEKCVYHAPFSPGARRYVRAYRIDRCVSSVAGCFI